MIKNEGDKWILYSKDGEKKLGTFDTEQEAKDREAEIIAAVAAKESKPLAESRKLADTWDRSLTEATIDKVGNLSGIIVVEGLSANQNDYTKAALESGRALFANRPIFINHPTRREMHERPERREEDRVGRLPSEQDIFVEALDDGRHALKFRNAKLSKTADWLAVKIREGISGAMSINAQGSGKEDGENFIVETFTAAHSLDFVTEASAGGVAIVEAQRTSNKASQDYELLTLELLAANRPDILNDIATRERRKAYGEKRELGNLREVYKMTKTQTNGLARRVATLEARLVIAEKREREQSAEQTLTSALVTESPHIQARVRQLVESKRRAFVEGEGDSAGSTLPGELAPTNPEASAGDPPKIELPPDAASLPEEAQAIYLETYTAHLAEGEDTAVHLAWASVHAAGWIKQGDTWSKMEPEDVAAAVLGDEEIAADGDVEVVTEEAFKAALGEAIKAEREYLAQATGAGRITGMGAAPNVQEASTEASRASLVEAYMAGGMSEEQAKLAATGRPGR